MHATLLEALFLTQRVPAWSSTSSTASSRRPRPTWPTGGLLCHLIGADEQRIAGDGPVAGMVFETFVVTELARQIAWQGNAPSQYHSRDRDGREVDVVLERRDGSVVAIEVKSSRIDVIERLSRAAPPSDKLGDRFKAGVLLYTGPSTVPFGDRLAAVPLSGLWAGIYHSHPTAVRRSQVRGPRSSWTGALRVQQVWLGTPNLRVP